MRRRWWEIAVRNREIDALAERMETRIHAVAIVLTAVVLGMRLVAGTQDLRVDLGSGEGPALDRSVADLASAPPQ